MNARVYVCVRLSLCVLVTVRATTRANMRLHVLFDASDIAWVEKWLLETNSGAEQFLWDRIEKHDERSQTEMEQNAE